MRAPAHRRAGALMAVACCALAVFVILARMDWRGGAPAWDGPLSAWVQGWSAPGIGALMWVVSWPGWTPQSWIIVACIAAILVRSGECLGVPLLLIAAGSQLVVRMIKITIDRARPNLGIEPHGPTDPSFPSGHVTQYTFVLGLLAYLAWRRMAPGFGRRVALTACGMLVMLVGPSRIFLGEHWPSDVLGGYLLGGGIVLITIAMLEWRRFGVRS